MFSDNRNSKHGPRPGASLAFKKFPLMWFMWVPGLAFICRAWLGIRSEVCREFLRRLKGQGLWSFWERGLEGRV